MNCFQTYSTTVAADHGVKSRLDIFLTAELESMSRAKIQSLIKEGYVQVNHVPETRPKYEPDVYLYLGPYKHDHDDDHLTI